MMIQYTAAKWNTSYSLKFSTKMLSAFYILTYFVPHVTFYFYARVLVTAIPLQAWTGPEGSRRLRLPDFKTVGT